MRPTGEAVQRVRVRFGRSGEAAFISHLDLMRFWERALRRASLPLAYSQGFTPHAKMSMAAPLALGVTSEAELMDLSLSRWVAPQNLTQALRRQLPGCIHLYEASTVPPTLPSLQSQVRLAEYRVVLDRSSGPADVASAIERFLSAGSIMWQHARDTGVRSYDMRPLVKELACEQGDPGEGSRIALRMLLRCDPAGAGRPEQVAAALGFTSPPLEVHRCRLLLEVARGARR